MFTVDLSRVLPDQVLLQRSASAEGAHWRLSYTHVWHEQPTVFLVSSSLFLAGFRASCVGASFHALLATSNTELAGFKAWLASIEDAIFRL
jgi:hypothetical protein